MKNFSSPRGFTLVELTLVLLIVALLMGGMMIPLSAQRDMQYIRETQQQMEEIKESLLGFVVSQGRLPCPDQDGDGKEDWENADDLSLGCKYVRDDIVVTGRLPYSTLGAPKADAWGHVFSYSVSKDFTLPITNLRPSGRIRVDSRAESSTAVTGDKVALVLAGDSPVVIISHGKNGYGPSAHGLTMPPASNEDETTNASLTIIKPEDKKDWRLLKYSRFATPPASPCSDTVEGQPFCEFDDLVTWISPYVLFNRLIAAGKLP